MRYARLPGDCQAPMRIGDQPVTSPGESGTGGSGQHPGSATLTPYVWRDSVVFVLNPGPDGTTAPCGFNIATAGLGARIGIDGYVPGSGGGASFSVSSRLRPDQSDALDTLLARRRDAVCDKGNPGLDSQRTGIRHASGPFGRRHHPDLREGVSGGGTEPQAAGDLNGEFTSYSVGFPVVLRKLLRGDSFSVSSGRRTYEGTNSQTAARAVAAVSSAARGEVGQSRDEPGKQQPPSDILMPRLTDLDSRRCARFRNARQGGAPARGIPIAIPQNAQILRSPTTPKGSLPRTTL